MRAETVKANFANINMTVFRGAFKSLAACIKPHHSVTEQQAVEMIKAVWPRAVSAAVVIETTGSVLSMTITPVFA